MPDTRSQNVRPPRHSRPATDTPAIAAKGAALHPRRKRTITSLRHEWEPYLFIDQLRLMPQGGEPGPGLRLLTAITVATDGRPTTRFLLPVRESHAECWVRMLTQLRREHLPDLRLIVADASPAFRAATLRTFPRVQWQQSIPAFCARVLAQIPEGQRKSIARRLQDIYRQPDRTAATARAVGVAALLARLGNWAGAVYFANGFQDTLTFYSFPAADWRQLREQATSSDLRGTLRRQLTLDRRKDGWLVESHDASGSAAQLHLIASPSPAAAAGGAVRIDGDSESTQAPGASSSQPPLLTISATTAPDVPHPDPTLPPGQSPVQNKEAYDRDGTDSRPAHRKSDLVSARGPAADEPAATGLSGGLDFIETEPTQPPAIRMEVIEVEDRYGYTALFEHEERAAALAAAGGASRTAQTPSSHQKGRLRRVADRVLETVGVAVLARPGTRAQTDARPAVTLGARGTVPANLAPAPVGPS
jgi:hypothetical protein